MTNEINQAQAAKKAIVEWIQAHSKKPDECLTETTPIFEAGHLDSIGVLELIFLLEELSGQEVDVEDLDPESFRDIKSIFRTFIAPYLK